MTTSRKTLYEGRYVRFIDRDGWEFVERHGTSGIVIIIAVTDARRLVLVEQFRPALGQQVVELPAGLVGDVEGQEDESFTTAAHRELIEETGYAAEEMVIVAEGAPSAGLTTEILTLIEARRLKKVGEGGGDETEDIIVHEVPLGDVVPWLGEQSKAGKAIDLKIYGGLYFATRSDALNE